MKKTLIITLMTIMTIILVLSANENVKIDKVDHEMDCLVDKAQKIKDYVYFCNDWWYTGARCKQEAKMKYCWYGYN